MTNEQIQELKAAESDTLALNGCEISNQLRHLADNEIDSDSFTVVIENYNGQEVEFERPITDLAINAAEMMDKLLAERDADKALIAEHERDTRIPLLKEKLAAAEKYIAELESFKTAYMEWSDKTEWVQTDKRFDVLIPWGKHRADVLKAYIEHLEARTLTVKLPDELYAIAENIRTQDNRCTDQPMFAVMQKREIIGSDEHSPSRIVWCWDGEEVSELCASRLEALHQGCRDTRGYDRYAMQEIDEFVTACFTEQGCKDYLARDGHNLRLPFIYAFGSFRNSEYQFIRKWLAGITMKVGGE